jgi:uncharacterized repeat protein (TIGR01451 family)
MMKNHTFRFLSSALLMTLILNSVLPISPILAQEPDPGDIPTDELITTPDPEMDYLYPADLDPPGQCDVPGKAPFGEDVEVLVGPAYGYDTYRLNQNPSWGGETQVPVPLTMGLGDAKSSNNVASVDIGADRIVAVWRENYYGNYPVYSIWNAGSGWSQSGILYTGGGGSYEPQVIGNPALLSRHPKNWVAFIRDDDDYIQYWEWNDGALGSWTKVRGNYYARSDPAVISTGPSHMAVFFKDQNGAVKFNEWTGGVGWRSEPISLGKPAGTSFSSELSVVSRNENHIAVFGMTSNNQLWVKEWTSQNDSDWGDTEWVYLMGGYSHFKPAVVSRHTNHMGVAVLTFISGSGVGASYKEWTYQSGWKDSVSLPLANNELWSPVTLAATSTDEMWLFAVDVDGGLRRNRWSEHEIWSYTTGEWQPGWSGWNRIHSGWKASSAAHNWTVAAVVRQPYDVMVIGRESDDEVISTHRTTLDRTVSKNYQENGRYGTPRAQAIAMVEGKPIWTTLWRSKAGNWFVQASQTSLNWSIYSGQKNLGHANSGSGQATGKRSVTAADIDDDGNDEVIVATMNAAGTQVDISLVELTVTASSISIASSKTTRTGLPVGADVNVAVGDLDGDGLDNEIVVGYTRLTSNIVKTFLYQYSDGSLQFKEAKEWTFSSLTGWIQDMELAIGKVQHATGEQLVIAVQFYVSTINVTDALYGIYRWGEDQRGDRTLEEIQTSTEGLFYNGARGEYSTALTTGDVDADGLEEIVYTYGPFIRVIDGDYYPHQTILHPAFSVAANDANRSLAVGDLDWDGKAEIVYAAGSTGWVGVIEKADNGALFRSAAHSSSQGGVPLVADLDNDSHEANLAGCKTFREVSVIAVVNGAPRHYLNGAPAHTTSGGVANSSSASSSAEDGWHVNLGESVSVGFKVEQSIPIIGTSIAEVRGSVTAELMASRMGATSTSESTTETTGFTFGVGESGYAQGMVVYDEAMYKCDYYDVYKPDAPEDTSRAMACTPTSNPIQTHTTLDHWRSTDFKDEATGSWADVGRDSDDVTLYPSANPIDSYLVKWEGNELLVHGSTSGGLYTTWSIEESSGEDKITGATWDLNTTVSAGATIGVVTVDASVTAGYGEQWSRSVGWEESLCIEGNVEHFTDDDCPGCSPYRIVPYVYQATALSEAGTTYPYLEADYYVPSIGSRAVGTEAIPQEIVGLAPKAPVITCTTHPISTTWYPTDTVAFEWGKPAGDLAVVAGYRWSLNDTETITPTSLVPILTQTHTYEGVPDGVHYLHLQALGDGGDYSEVAHRAVRVDVNPPQVAFVLDPMATTGFFDWYNTPVTVTVSATDTTGSGVNTVEYRVDSSAWQTYTTPITFVTDTLTTTLWARATDSVGHISDPVSTTIKLDLTPPSLLDGDGCRLTYASIITDELGNAQLVLGGALSDTLAGRLMTEIKLGDDGLWRPVNSVGEFPIPPDNDLITTDTVSLNWIYTPTFEARGAWTIWGRGTDRAGNTTEPFGIAGFYWEPDAAPDLVESLVSVAPGQVYAGDTVTFTLGVRNTGYQEAQIVLTNTVPAGLTVLTDTISGGGQYDAGSGAISWALDALWPGETRYLFFSARVDAGLALTESLTLENRLDVLGYWVWEDPYGVMPPAPPSYTEAATTTLTVLTGTLASASPPHIFAADVLEGAVVDDPQVTLFVEASPDAEFLYVKEWVWDTVSDTWTLAQESGWVSFEEADGLEVSENIFSKQGRYQWMLSEGDGVKYLGVWVADADQQTTNLNDANLIYTNLMSAGGQTLDAGERVQYRVPLRADELAIFNLVTLSGDADLYIWKPRFAFRPHYLSNAEENGFHIDTLGFFAEEEGVHIVEVEAVTDGTTYRLATAGDMPGAALLAETRTALTSDQRATLAAQDEAMRGIYAAAPQGVQVPLQEKERPAHPLILSTPYGLEDAEVLPEAPEAPPEEPVESMVYLPLVMRSE